VLLDGQAVNDALCRRVGRRVGRGRVGRGRVAGVRRASVCEVCGVGGVGGVCEVCEVGGQRTGGRVRGWLELCGQRGIGACVGEVRVWLGMSVAIGDERVWILRPGDGKVWILPGKGGKVQRLDVGVRRAGEGFGDGGQAGLLVGVSVGLLRRGWRVWREI
jgi:hypothetical protein